MSRAFLDAVSGQPLSRAAIAVRDGFSERAWADPNQPYHEGRVSAQILQAARETTAAVLGVSPSGVSFVSRESAPRVAISAGLAAIDGRSGSGRTGARGRDGKDGPPRLWTSPIERAPVLDALEELTQRANAERTALRVDPRGTIELDTKGETLGNLFGDPIGEEVDLNGGRRLALVQAANLEVGTLQPLAALTSKVELDGLVTDATGALGLIDIPPVWSVLFADAGSWAGPADAAIVARRGASKQLPDTADVLTAAQCAGALHDVYTSRRQLTAHLFGLVERIRTQVPSLISDVDVLGDPVNRLPHVVTFSFLYADGERLASELDRRGVAVGSGSACASRAGLPSHVLSAIGALTHGNVRVSLPLGATSADIDHFLHVLPDAVAVVRAEAGAP